MTCYILSTLLKVETWELGFGVDQVKLTVAKNKKKVITPLAIPFLMGFFLVIAKGKQQKLTLELKHLRFSCLKCILLSRLPYDVSSLNPLSC